MHIYTSPPEMTTFFHDKPTLLVCWWATLFSTSIILIRVAGRLVRTEFLFPEDKTAFWSLIPLYIRLAVVHCVLLWGTNNADFTDEILTETQLRHKQIASGLVLIARIFFAGTLWVLKWSTLEFLKRLTDSSWERSYTKTILYARITLGVSFLAVVITIFVECTPFTHYWQVLPDPGPRCRQAYTHLIVTGSMNIITDLMLVIIPIPIIVRSTMPAKRKTQLIILFSLNLSVVVVSLIRVRNILKRRGNQQYRSLMASVELLFAVASANALVLGSFVRDRGLKKKKFRFGDENLSSDHHSNSGTGITGAPQRQPVYKHQWGSDEDLVQGLGLGLKPELRQDLKMADPKDMHPHFSSAAAAAPGMRPIVAQDKKMSDEWQIPFHQRQKSRTELSEDSLIPRDHHRDQIQSQTSGLSPMPPSDCPELHVTTPSTSSVTPSPEQATAIAAAASSPLSASKGNVSFFDLGGLLEAGGPIDQGDEEEDIGTISFRRKSYSPKPEPLTLSQQQNQSYWAYQSAMLAAPMPTASLAGFTSGKRASTAILHDLGGLLAPISSGNPRGKNSPLGLGVESSAALTGSSGSSRVATTTTTTTATATATAAVTSGISGSASVSHQKKKSGVVKGPGQKSVAGSPVPSPGASPEDGPGFADMGGLLR